MRDAANRIVSEWRSSYLFQTLLSSSFSTAATAGFALFNGALGVMHQSAWCYAIALYYFILTVIRLGILRCEVKGRSETARHFETRQRRTFFRTHIALLLMNVSMFGPVILMVKGDHTFTFGLIPAIAMATYTTYRVSKSIFHLRKAKRSDNIMVAVLRTIDFLDSMVAVLALQNAMIYATEGMNAEMQTLSGGTSTGILLVMFAMTVLSFLKYRKLWATR
ncbi:Uncharacterised protein [Slackia heliotrinireducens]|uniref:Uncharacterized protein n=1 Tax=Slackia heliotrinireducens (strain ATCC 29202 / DSM 20476 / NCTC 11029 / RHS 1) TaxID=471855 RepID=C7N358_SLAHD|nr:hypothetical protein [Slackia heliotrinireducens]ACV21579.1 hypothetical protein Shel_05200 [Slackia heliotrinireducens DSM 20476]VEG99098.1 Uncharacterised protein [Slackia heliotrinireducens]